MTAHDLIIIGGGPGGYVAAIHAAQLGLNVACIEREPSLGGTCLRIGCIPSKALLESSELYEQARTAFAAHGIKAGEVALDLPTMLKRKEQIVTMLGKGIDGLFKKNKITRYAGHGRLAGGGKVIVTPSAAGQAEIELQGKSIIVATGSRPSTLKGVELSGDRIGTSTEALSFPAVPQHLVVIGAGYIGLELGTVWRRLGAKVTVLEFLDRIFPGTDGEIANEAMKIFARQGIEFRLKTSVTAAKVEGDACVVTCSNGDTLRCDRVLVSTGRVPYTENLGLEAAGVQKDERGRVVVNQHFATSAAGVYAIGDVIKGPMLAHKAEHEGVACVDHIVTGHGHVNYDAIPSVAYTEPEVAAVGKTEEELKAANIPYKIGSFPFLANGRARALGHTEGRVKVLAHAQTDRILGVHIIGPRAGDMIGEATAAIEFGASSEDLGSVTHAHPTLTEVLKEASLAVLGRAIHA